MQLLVQNVTFDPFSMVENHIEVTLHTADISVRSKSTLSSRVLVQVL